MFFLRHHRCTKNKLIGFVLVYGQVILERLRQAKPLNQAVDELGRGFWGVFKYFKGALMGFGSLFFWEAHLRDLA